MLNVIDFASMLFLCSTVHQSMNQPIDSMQLSGLAAHGGVPSTSRPGIWCFDYHNNPYGAVHS